MANTSRQSAVSDGQLVTELRSRVQSDFQSRHHAELEGMIADVGEPCWLSGPTSAALHGFDGFRLATPHHLLVPRERNVRRVGVVVHRTEHIELLDRCVVRGLPATSAARTLIDLSAYTSVDVLTVALDGALRDGLISERFLTHASPRCERRVGTACRASFRPSKEARSRVAPTAGWNGKRSDCSK